MRATSFQVRWLLANVAGSAIGFSVFAVIAHGFASPHNEEHPTPAQFAAHALGLVPAGAIIALGHKLGLGQHARLARWYVPATSLSLTAAFLVGAYGLAPPFDFLFAYAAVGAALDLASSPVDTGDRRGRVRGAAAMSLLFTAGSFLGMLALSLVARGIGLRLGAPGEDVARHVLTMALGGLFIGAAVGLVSARGVAKQLLPLGPTAPPDRQ